MRDAIFSIWPFSVQRACEDRSPKDVFDVVDHVLREYARREDRIGDFRTIYFSDTIIFYQKPVGWGSWTFSDVYAIGGMIWAALAASRIPCLRTLPHPVYAPSSHRLVLSR